MNGRGYWETSEDNLERELYQEFEDRIEGIEEDVLQGFMLDLGMIL